MLDRPLRFIVTRGARGAARGDTLSQLQDELDRPFTEHELADLERSHEERHRERREHKRERFHVPPGKDRGKRGAKRRRR